MKNKLTSNNNCQLFLVFYRKKEINKSRDGYGFNQFYIKVQVKKIRN